MFKFFEKKKQLPENPIEPKAPEDKKSINDEVMRVILEAKSQGKAQAEKIEEERKKMRPQAKEMYEKIIEEAKKEGDAEKQKVFEAALQEVEKQISKDQEKKEE